MDEYTKKAGPRESYTDYFSMLQKAKESGFQSVEEFVSAHLHLLPPNKKRLFHLLRRAVEPREEPLRSRSARG